MRGLVLGVMLALAIGAGQTALAASEAVLERPLARPRIVVLDGKVWTCRKQSCTARLQGVDQPARRECFRVRRAVGPIAAFARDGAVLDSAQLAACNNRKRRDRTAS